jgi:fructokinase
MTQYGLIEAGGTKFVLGVADAGGAIAATHRIPTTTPDQTLGAAITWFREQRLTKPHWSHADIAGPFAKAFSCPVAIETDVNGAALAEARWGAGKGQASLLYLTVGTGVGGGFVNSSGLLHGVSHPEMGHIRMPRHPDDAGFTGSCPFHGDCLEGLASGPAIIARWGQSLSQLGASHPGNAMIGWYLGQAVCTFQAIMEPARVVLGGGVMGTPGLLEIVRMQAARAGAGYFAGDPSEVVVAPGLGTNSGLLGALAVALSLTS